ncbi:xylulokinase [Francisella sp. 19X1-34]|uniref:xylulokinase n=1 Tax=Francisella sp. 19X1-34 TaxID=3087177 RepID=UPI002E34E612|nr:xylulokinase [Francisella sp. 19X1-34]MED7788391.1 xylulokinase [Francisella sp. 19X1-34]
MSIVVGIDSGTQGTKVLLVDTEKKSVLSEAYCTHEIIVGENGKREQDPNWWIESFRVAFKDAVSQAGISSKNIDAMGISAQQHGFVPLDENKKPLYNAKLWCDTETAKENDDLLNKLGNDNGINTIGIKIQTGYTASKILWFKNNKPELYRQMKYMCLPHDFLNLWLTDKYYAEHGDASGTGIYDVREQCWSKEICQLIDSSGKLYQTLPKLKLPNEKIGFVKPDIADQLGLRHDVIISTGGGDNMMGAIGSGNIKNGIITMSLGTSGTVYSYSDKYIDFDSSVANFCSSSGHWLPLICTMNVTSALSEINNLLGVEVKDIDELVNKSNIGSNGILTLPFFNGERVPELPLANASIHNLNSFNFCKANLVRSIMESVTFGLKYGLDLLVSKMPNKPKEIRLIGGGSNSKIWRQIVADITGIDVVIPLVNRGAALGAAIQASWAIKSSIDYDIVDQLVKMDYSTVASPIKENVIKYKEVYNKYLLLLNSTYNIKD